MKYLFYILFAVALCACQQENSTPPAKLSTSLNLASYTLDNLPNGVVRASKTDVNGRIAEEGYLLDGKRNGVWTTYKDGRAHTFTSYANDILNGKKFEFDHRRQIVLEETYVNGILSGKRGTYKSGRPKLEEYYVNGERHGPYRKYFETGKEQGKISQYVDYVHGKIDGKVRHYNVDGGVIVEYTYKNGNKVSGGIVE